MNEEKRKPVRQSWSEYYAEVEVPPEIQLHDISEKQPLLRFIDLPKLLDLLVHEHLMVPKLKLLIAGDPFECSARMTYDHLSREKKMDELRHQAIRYAPRGEMDNADFAPVFGFKSEGESKFSARLKEMSDPDLDKALWFCERERLKEELKCCCWYLGTDESDAMWKIYANQFGVAFTTTVERLRSSLRAIRMQKKYAGNSKLVISKVRYDDRKDCGEFKPWLLKRKAFQHENEARLYFLSSHSSDQVGLRLTVDISVLIENIIVSPFAEKWQFLAVKSAIKTILDSKGITRIKISQSEHMCPPDCRWPKPENESLAKLFGF